MAQYEIIIKNQANKKGKSPIADNEENGQTEQTTQMPTGGVDIKQIVGSYFAVKRIVSPFIKQAIDYGISTVSVRTGANEQQQRVQFAYDLGSKAVGYAENIAVGAAVGGVWGAVGAAVLGVVTTAVGVSLNQQKINLNESLENISLNLMNMRAGGSVSTNGSR